MHANVNERRTFNPPEEIVDNLFLSDFNMPQTKRNEGCYI